MTLSLGILFIVTISNNDCGKIETRNASCLQVIYMNVPNKRSSVGMIYFLESAIF